MNVARSEPALVVVDVRRGFDFDRADLTGRTIPAEELARVTAANLHDEFAMIVDTATALTQ
jgi:hypothetical protein